MCALYHISWGIAHRGVAHHLLIAETVHGFGQFIIASTFEEYVLGSPFPTASIEPNV